MPPSSPTSTGIESVPASACKRSRCSGHGSTCRATKSTPSSVSTSRTAEENGHHSACQSVSTPSATEAVLPVSAVAERLVRRAAAAAERGPVALVQQAPVGRDDADAAAHEQRAVLRGAHLELVARHGRPAGPAGAQCPGRAPCDGRLHLAGGRGLDLNPRAPGRIEDLRQRAGARLGGGTQARPPPAPPP